MRLRLVEHEPTLLWPTILFALSSIVNTARCLDVHDSHLRHKHKRLAVATPSTIATAAGTQPPSSSIALSSAASIANLLPTSTPSLSLTTLPSIIISLPSTSPQTPSVLGSIFQSMISPSASPSNAASPSSTASSPSTGDDAAPQTDAGGKTYSSSKSGKPNAAEPTAPSASTLAIGSQAPAPSVQNGKSLYPSSVVTGGPASSNSTSTSKTSSGFFSNPGAVAGAFSILGIIGLMGAVGVGMLIVRRRRARLNVDDTEHLDKSCTKQDVPMQPTHEASYSIEATEDELTPTEMAHYMPPLSEAVHPAIYYPNYQYYTTPSQPQSQGQGYLAQLTYSPADYGIAYPPGHQGVSAPHFSEGPSFETAPLNNEIPNSLRPSVPRPQSHFFNDGLTSDPRRSVNPFYAGTIPTSRTSGDVS